MFLAFQTNGSIWANKGRREEEVIWAMPKRKHSFFLGPFPVLVFLYNKFLFKLEVKSFTDAINPLQGWLSLGGLCCFSFGLEFWWLTTKHSSQLAYLPTCKVCNCCKVLFSRSHDFVVLTRCQTWLTLTKCLLKSYSWDAIFFKSNPTFPPKFT